jgi:WD40 repeat protein
MPLVVRRLLLLIPLLLIVATLGTWAYRTFTRPTEPAPEIRIESRTVQGIKIEVEFEQSDSASLRVSSGPDSIRFVRGDDVLEYDSGLLMINEIGMPDVKPGDTVRWNREGPLLINGQPVKPHPLQARPIAAESIDAQWSPLESPYPRDTLSVAWAGTTRLLVVAHGDGAVRVWDVDHREVLKTMVPGPPKESPGKFGLRAAVSPDGKSIAAANLFGEEVTLWDLATGNKTAAFTEPKGKVNGVQFASDAVLLEARGGQLISRDLKGGMVKSLDAVHTEFAVPFAVHSGKHWRVVNSGAELKWATGGPEPARSLRSINPVTPAACFAFSVDCNSIAIFDGGKRLALEQHLAVDDVTGIHHRPLRWRGKLGSANSIHALAFAPDGQTLAVGDSESIRLYDVPSGRERGGLSSPWVRSLAYSADGRTLAAGLRYQPGLRMWNTADLVAK